MKTAEPEREEARTLAVEYDSHGERFKSWRIATSEMVTDEFPDFPVEGPRTMQWLAKFFVREGKTPTQWLDGHLAAKRYQDSDRAVHELKSLARIMETGGSYDQLNLASLGSFELVARRWQLILEAHRDKCCLTQLRGLGVLQRPGAGRRHRPCAVRACGQGDEGGGRDREAERQGS